MRRLVTLGDWPLDGSVSSQGIAQSPFALYLHAAAYAAGRSLSSIQWLITAAAVGGQALLLAAGEELGGGAAYLFACALLAFAPYPIFTLYQRFWIPCYTPLFACAALLFLLRYARTGSGRWLAAAYAAVGATVQMVPAAVLAGPVLLAAPLAQTRRLDPRWALVFTAIAWAAAAPYCVWAAAAGHGAVAAAAAAAAAALIFASCTARVGDRAQKTLLLALPPCAAALAMSLGWTQAGLNALKAVVDLSAPVNADMADRLGLPIASWARAAHWAFFPLLAAALAALAARWDDPRDRSLLLSLWIPVWGAAVCAAGFPLASRWLHTPSPDMFYIFPAHWLSFLLPAVFLAAARGLTSNKARRRAGLTALGAAACAAVATSLWLTAGLRRTGGLWAHMASLGVKERVLERIYRTEPRARVLLPVGRGRFFGYGVMGWVELSEEMRGHLQRDPHSRSIFYIVEPRGIGFYLDHASLAKELEADSMQQFGPVELYHGRAVRGRFGFELP